MNMHYPGKQGGESMQEDNFQLVETGLLVSLIVILVAIIYIIAGGNLGELLANFI